MEFIKMITDSVKNLLGKKTTQDILKYLATVTLNYASRRFGIEQYKYDPIDMKTMVFNHNMNNEHKINVKDLEQIICLFTINRFMEDLNKSEETSNSMNKLVQEIAKLCNDGKLIETYADMNDSKLLYLFDKDTLETSSIADNYEISSGGIYVPDRTIHTVTQEGTELATAKNDYLDKRLELGFEASSEELLKLIQDYYNRIKYDDMIEYFKK